MSDEQVEPKIVVDEDWKSRVQAEKVSAAKQTGHSDSTDEEKSEEAAGGQVPAASFELLLSTLGAQALTAMGKLADPAQGHAVVRPDLAQHVIDMLAMLEQKTKGNLTKMEADMLENVLHQLRMAFVTIRREPQKKTAST